MTTPTTPAKIKRSALSVLIIAVVIAAALALMGVFAILLLRSASAGIDGSLAAGEPAQAPTFDLELLNQGTLRPELAPLASKLADKRVTNSDLIGTPVVLNLWASWCLPCREEAPIFKAVSESPEAQGVLFLGLNSLDGRSAAKRFARRYALTYPNIREYENTITRKFGASAFPETFFLDRDGQIVGHVIGAISKQQLLDGMTAARAGIPGKPTRGGAQGAAD